MRAPPNGRRSRVLPSDGSPASLLAPSAGFVPIKPARVTSDDALDDLDAEVRGLNAAKGGDGGGENVLQRMLTAVTGGLMGGDGMTCVGPRKPRTRAWSPEAGAAQLRWLHNVESTIEEDKM